MIVDFVVLFIIAVMFVAAVAYIRKQKKKGAACIGCPHSGDCAKHKQSCCGSDSR